MVHTVFNKIKTVLKYLYEECRAVYYLQLQNTEKKESDKPIRVGFIVQMPEIWDKESPVYEEMLNDSRFAPALIVVPPYDQKLKTVGTEYNDNYFRLKYPDSIKAYGDDGKWYAFDKKEYDYIFFQRPYDIYLPPIYKSRNIISKAKCCYIPYGYSGADFFNKGNTKRSFFRNMSFVFAESGYMANILRKAYKKWWFADLHNVLNLGYPALIPYFNIKPSNCFNNILWTPRWTYAPRTGGSHFLEYKDIFLQLRHLINSNHVSITFRPHPLMFGELVSKGLMQQDEVDIYIENLRKNGIEYDRGKPIFESFQNTDILITDFSTIIVQFFITGRPIIYCEGDVELNQVYSKLREGMYIAYNEQDIVNHIKALQTGNDYLLEKRQKLIKELFNIHLEATRKIVDYIASDYQNGSGGKR